MEIVLGILLVGAAGFWVYLIRKARDINDIKDKNFKLTAENTRLQSRLNDLEQIAKSRNEVTAEQFAKAITDYFGV